MYFAKTKFTIHFLQVITTSLLIVILLLTVLLRYRIPSGYIDGVYTSAGTPLVINATFNIRIKFNDSKNAFIINETMSMSRKDILKGIDYVLKA